MEFFGLLEPNKMVRYGIIDGIVEMKSYGWCQGSCQDSTKWGQVSRIDEDSKHFLFPHRGKMFVEC